MLNERLFFIRSVFHHSSKPWATRLPGCQVVKVNVTKFSLQSMFLNIKPNLFCQMRPLERKEGGGNVNFFYFYFFNVPLQRAPEWTLCILLVRRCHDCFRMPFPFCPMLQRPHLSSPSSNSEEPLQNISKCACQFGLSAFVKTEGPPHYPARTTDQDSLARLPSFNTQLKAHFFSKTHIWLVACCYYSFNDLLAGNHI